MAKLFEEFRLAPHAHFTPRVTYVSAPCSTGKTTAICKKTVECWQYATNVMIVLPTIKLVAEVAEKLINLGMRPTVITGKSVDPNEKVLAKIVKALKTARDEGRVLIITWNAFSTLPYFHRRENWNIIIDEIPQVDVYFSIPLALCQQFIAPEIEKHDCAFDGLHRVVAKHARQLGKRKPNGIGDHKLEKLIADLYRCLSSLTRDVFITEADYRDMCDPASKGDTNISFLAMLKPRLFDNATIVGANVRETLLFEWLSKPNNSCRLIEDQSISNKLNLASHQFGNRASIRYLLERDRFSKTLKQKHAKGGNTVHETMDRVAIDHLKDQPFLFVTNNSDDTTEFDQLPNCTKMPVICHGRNEFSGYHAIYISAALNRTPIHNQMLVALGFTREEIVRATAHEVYYQAVMRTSLRTPDSTIPVEIIVPDRASANCLAALLGVDDIARLPCADLDMIQPFTNTQTNCRSTYFGLLDRLQNQKQLPFPFKDSIEKGNEIWFYNSKVFVTLHETIRDMTSNSFSQIERKEFIRVLRAASKAVIENKENINVYNPAIYEPRDASGSLKCGKNFVRSSCVVFDFDKGHMPHTEIIKMFGKDAAADDRLPFIICNSFSRSEQQPHRFRLIVFFAQPAETVEQHHRTWDWLAWKLERAGWSMDKTGLDHTSRTPVKSFYLPCINRLHPGYAFYEEHNLRQREIARYGLVPSMLPEHEACDAMPNINGVEFTDDVPQDKIDAIVNSVTLTKGQRNDQLFHQIALPLVKLRHNGKRLARIQVAALLAQKAGQDGEMKRKVRDAMKSLDKGGWFG